MDYTVPPAQHTMGLGRPSGDARDLSQPLQGSAPPSAPAPTAPHHSPPPSAPPEIQPWQVGPQNIYSTGASHQQAFHFPAPAHEHTVAAEVAWTLERRRTLREWGQRRERTMHRAPKFLMDQMVSGSGLYPLRLLDDDWFLDRELTMIHQLEKLLEGTGHGLLLAKDMLAPLVYGIDVRIILDNSGSMQLDMLGRCTTSGHGINSTGPWVGNLLEQTLQQALPAPWFSSPTSQSYTSPTDGLDPARSRWFFARDALRHWMAVFQVIGIDPVVYLLNPVTPFGSKLRGSQLEALFDQSPRGTTPMPEAIYRAMQDHKTELSQHHVADDHGGDSLLHLLVLTDGEANDMTYFSRCLDEIQNLAHGDVQVCLMGLSLVKQDIEWFEDEECEETRIRTVEAYEVEQRQIQMREVVRREGGYNFLMHNFRVLVTNYFPADYDYEAPLQNLRHRLYITWHGRDRWWSQKCPPYYCVSQLFCTGCFMLTCAHCAGWCQGHDCGKCRKPDALEACCGEE